MSRSVATLVDEQILRWRVERMREETESRSRRKEPPSPDVIAICNAIGSGATIVSRKLAGRLDLPLYDREIVAHIADSSRVQVETVETLDERAMSRVDDYLTALWHEKNFDQSDYIKALTRTVTALWAHGPCVFHGHGAGHIVPRQHVLSVRLTAPRDVRIARVQEREGWSRLEAQRFVERTDEERDRFATKYFRSHVDNPHMHDLVINTELLDYDTIAEMIVTAYRRRFGVTQASAVTTAA